MTRGCGACSKEWSGTICSPALPVTGRVDSDTVKSSKGLVFAIGRDVLEDLPGPREVDDGDALGDRDGDRDAPLLRRRQLPPPGTAVFPSAPARTAPRAFRRQPRHSRGGASRQEFSTFHGPLPPLGIRQGERYGPLLSNVNRKARAAPARPPTGPPTRPTASPVRPPGVDLAESDRVARMMTPRFRLRAGRSRFRRAHPLELPRQGLMRTLGAELAEVRPGSCEIRLPYPRGTVPAARILPRGRHAPRSPTAPAAMPPTA